MNDEIPKLIEKASHAVDSKFHRWLIDAFDKRIKGDYDVDSLLDEQDVEEMIAHAKEFASFVNQYISK